MPTRCENCGALVNSAVAARRERLGERVHRLTDPFDWLAAVPALAIVPLALTDVLPRWRLIVALVLSFRLIFRAWSDAAGTDG